jgi:hypothetical protein
MKAMELILTTEQAAAIEWRKAKSIQFGEATGRDELSGAFWARTDGLEYLPFVDIVERSLEAHGWETNIENLLFSLESARIARRALIQSTGTSGNVGAAGSEGKRAVTFENVFAMDLPQRGRSGKLLKRLYALVSGAPNGSIAAPGSTDIDKHPAMQMMKSTISELEAEVSQLRAERSALIEKSKARDRENAVQLMQPAIRAEGGVEIRHLEVRSIDTERRIVGFRGSERSFELPFAALPKYPVIGSRALGVIESRKVTGILPTGADWVEFSLVPGWILAANKTCIKYRIRGRREFLLPLTEDSPQFLRLLRRSDEIVVKMAGDQSVDICASSEKFQQDANLRERLFQLRTEELGHQSFVRRQRQEESEPLDTPDNQPVRRAS